MRSAALALLVALGILGLAPLASSHGLVNLNVVVPPDCPGQAAGCLTTTEAQPRLHAGDEISFFGYNDAPTNHTLHVVALANATPPQDASPAHALASTGPIAPNGSRDAGPLTIPTNAEALYVWCSVAGHEADGEHLLVPVEPRPEDEGSRAAPAPGPGWLAGLLGVAGSLARLRRDTVPR